MIDKKETLHQVCIIDESEWSPETANEIRNDLSKNLLREVFNRVDWDDEIIVCHPYQNTISEDRMKCGSSSSIPIRMEVKVQPLIRCRSCKHWTGGLKNKERNEWHYFGVCDLGDDEINAYSSLFRRYPVCLSFKGTKTKPDHFCGYAERRCEDD